MHDRELKALLADLARDTDPDRVADTVRERIRKEEPIRKPGGELFMKKTIRSPRSGKRWQVILTAAALVIVLTAAVAAAPIIRNFINAQALQNGAAQRTEVPDGWIGVWTKEDLDAVREDLGANYILMADISFEDSDFEDGAWTPIGTYFDPFTGVFDGNGHTIDGLYIDASTDTMAERRLYGNSFFPYAVGLFGYVRSVQEYITFEYEVPIIYTEFIQNDDGTETMIQTDSGRTQTVTGRTADQAIWGRGGTVENLRLTRGVLRVDYEPVVRNEPYINEAGEPFGSLQAYCTTVGPIAGYADYVLGCAVEDFRVEVRAVGEEAALEWERDTGKSLGGQNRNLLYLNVGGVTGGSYLTDSCSSDAFILVRSDVGYEIPNPSVGGIGGVMSACVTSYYNGEIDSGVGDCGIGYLREDDVPRVLPESVLNEIAVRLIGIFPDFDENGVLTLVRAENYEELAADVRQALDEGRTLREWDEEMEERFGENRGWTWNMNKFLSFYMANREADQEILQNFYTDDAADETFFILDVDLKPREYKELSDLISAAFPDGDFEDFCRENAVKYGAYYVYDLRADPECAFEGFDFDVIWDREDGRLPVLRLFK